jgi:glycosyltransferase involved in cell wall biosynthesis
MTKINSFTVVTPVFNREDCIQRCIESVLSQNYPALEFWIVDDGSQDKTSSIIDSYMAENSFIKFHKFPLNKGVNTARNHAILNSTSDFVILLDSDDYFISDALNFVNKAINAHVGYMHYLFAQDDREWYYNNNSILNKEISQLHYDDFLTGRVSGDFVHVIKRDVLRNVTFNENLRIYEYINFLSLYKLEGNQLFINKTIVRRDRNRLDSVSKTSLLTNKEAIKTQYNALNEDVRLFADDYIYYCAKQVLQDKMKKQYLLGLAAGLYKQNSELKSFARKYKIGFPLLYTLFTVLRLGFIVNKAIITYSTIKNTFKRSE